MGNTSQIKRVLLIILLFPLASILFVDLLTFTVDSFINQKRIGKTDFYISYQMDGAIPILVRKPSFFAKKEEWISEGRVYYVYWNQSFLIFPEYTKDFHIKRYNIINYDDQNIELISWPLKDSVLFFSSIDSLGLKTQSMNYSSIRCRKNVFDDLSI